MHLQRKIFKWCGFAEFVKWCRFGQLLTETELWMQGRSLKEHHKKKKEIVIKFDGSFCNSSYSTARIKIEMIAQLEQHEWEKHLPMTFFQWISGKVHGFWVDALQTIKTKACMGTVKPGVSNMLCVTVDQRNQSDHLKQIFSPQLWIMGSDFFFFIAIEF